MDFEMIFTVCFFVGIGLTVVSMIFGQFFDLFGVDGLDFMDVSLDIGLPTSPLVYVLGLTVFGGIGLILQKVTPMSDGIIGLLAVISAVIVSMCFYRLIIIPLRKAQNTSAPAQEELIGIMATVVETIPKDGYGEISYVVNGNSFKAPAKSSEKQQIEKNTEVSICWMENYVFYVVEINKNKVEGTLRT